MARHVELSAEAQRAFRKEALPWIENVRRFARSLCQDASDSDDLVQETYLRAYISWHTFQEGTDCRRWLFTICRNVFRHQLRDARTAEGIVALPDSVDQEPRPGASDLEPGDASRDSERIFTQLDVSTALDTALPQVPEPYRSALVLVLIEDQTYEAAAMQLEVPVGTIRSRLYRARRLVRDYLVEVARDAGVIPFPGTHAEHAPRDSRAAGERWSGSDEYRTDQSDV